jgi:hypothetical protein
MKSAENVGGPFVMKYQKILKHHENVSTGAFGPLEHVYRGPMVATGPGYADVLSWNLDNPINTLKSMMPSLYNEMKPTKPAIDLANALYELKDLAGMYKQLLEPLRHIKSLPIAWDFGWRPLLNDIRKLAREQVRWQKKLQWLIKNEGKPVRTTSRIHTTVDSTYPSETFTTYNAVLPTLVTQLYKGVPTYTRSVEWKTDYWASARWVWFLPAGPRDILWKSRMYGKLMGLDVTPAYVWNALPWSWLIDWFTNAGDCIQNLDSGVADRCYADRFYGMAHRYRHDTWAAKASLYGPGGSTINIAPITESYSGWKVRIRGNAFGLQLVEEQLNDDQWKILGELGLSRL